MNNNLYNEIKNDNLIKLADSAFCLQDYVSRYFKQEISILEADEMFNQLNQRAPINSEIKVKVTKSKSRGKKPSAKLITA